MASTVVDQSPSMVLLPQYHYSHIQVVVVGDHHKSKILHVMRLALMVDKEELPHGRTAYHHDCQNCLFRLMLVSRLEREVQIRQRYRSAFQVYCGVAGCYMDHHSAEQKQYIQDE